MNPKEGRFEFGPFRLDLHERQLLRDGRIVRVEPSQFRVLAMLVCEAGRLVTRESLFQSVWAGAHVEEGSLTLAISVLRKALGDSPSESKYIETVRKAGLPGGYRFVAPVRELPSPGMVLANAGPLERQQLPSGPARQHRSGLWTGAGARARATISTS